MASQTVESSVQEELDRFFEQRSSLAQWSVFVEEIDSGKPLYSRYANSKLIPASNMKLVVCSAILLQLGPDFTYKTPIYLSGTQENQTFHGDLLVVGSGDPSIGGRFNNGDITASFREWAALLKQRNITRITGNIIGIDDVFDENRRGLNWSPLDYIEWYAAEIAGLTLNDACIDVYATGAAQAGSPASISLDPDTKYIQVDSKMTTVASRKAERGIILSREPESTLLSIEGSISAKQRQRAYASVYNPTHFFVTVLKETLEREGIQVEGLAIDGDDAQQRPKRETWELVHTHESPPLIDLVQVCQKSSQNLYAEHFLKTLGAQEYGVGSYESGTLAIKDVLFNHGCNLDDQYIADGSGLSRENMMNAKSFVHLLRTVMTSKYAEPFQNTLPIAGTDGTLRYRLRETATRGKIYAKTGTMKGVSALSGILKTKSGKTCLFSIIGNSSRNLSLSNTIDEACAILVSNG